MKYTRIYTGSDQQSYFQDLDMQLSEADIGKLTSPIGVENILFGEVEDRADIDWHNPPCRQYVIMLQGAMEIEIGDGTKRVFNEGDVVLAEDITGQGHMTRAASDGIRRYLAIPLKQ